MFVIFSIQESVFKEEPLLTGLEYFKHITSRDDLKVYFEKYDFLKAVDDDGSISGLICASENNYFAVINIQSSYLLINLIFQQQL